jgi:hypothetical protein
VAVVVAVTAGVLESEQPECPGGWHGLRRGQAHSPRKLFAVLSTVMTNKQSERFGKVGLMTEVHCMPSSVKA